MLSLALAVSSLNGSTGARPYATGNPQQTSLVINEIMYHPYHPSPGTENIGAEYIELLNRGSEPVNLAGWKLSNGVNFVFPDITLGAGEYLVVAADDNVFTTRYPGVTNFIGGWEGRLSNSGETIELIDDTGVRVNRIRYADEGDWALRELGEIDYNHRGWLWLNGHDGGGKSLELINPALSNEYGQNWAAGISDEGTPGAVNSVAADDVAPLILDVVHFPIIPGPNDSVTVTARVVDEMTTGITVTMHYRVDTSVYDNKDTYPHHDPNDYNSLVMFDDGAHGDGVSDDGVYGAEIPRHPDGTIIEFYLEGIDAGFKSRTWPAPSIVDGSAEQVTNLLYQVDDSFEPYWVPGKQPVYYLIMTEAERGRLAYIGSHSADRRSDAQMNGTFITVDGVNTTVRYSVGIRNRGKSTRIPPPNNYRINIPHDQSWKGVTAININSKYAFSQLIGSALWRRAGLPAANATAVQVRVNGRNLALDDPAHMYGSYVALEVLDSEWAEHHFPDNSAGNLYRCADYDQGYSAELAYEGDNPDAYRNAYFKNTNESEDDWTDLINLTYILNNDFVSNDEFIEQVGQVINIEQWMRYLAVDSLAGNLEGGLNTGKGDDYAMYRGGEDPRFWLIPHDLDTILGHRSADPDRSIFTFFERVEGLHRLLNHPEIVRIYYSQLLDLIDTVFAPEKFNFLIDHILGDWVPQSKINQMKQFVEDRIGYVLDQVPQGKLTVSSNLPQTGGYHYLRGTNTIALSGTANAVTTRSVLVNGHLAEWSRKEGAWFIDYADLYPGINRIIVKTLDGQNGTGNELEHEYIDIWCDTGPTNDYPKNNGSGNQILVSDLRTKLMVRDSYLPGIGILVRIEVVRPDGNIERDLWDAAATLSVDNPNVNIFTNRIVLRNGLGSALVTFTGRGDFTLTANVNGTEDSRLLLGLSNEPVTSISGTLAGSSTIWDGIIHITDDLLVPTGHTLTIRPGTLILLDGVSSGSAGTDIDVKGTIESLGTASAPITFTAYNPARAWGEIHHDYSSPSIYQYTNITRAGHSPGGGHTGSGPAIRPAGSNIVFDYVSITDNDGKAMQSSSDSDLTFRHCQLARSVMGPEINNTALLFEDSWITEMLGPNDNDGIYIHSQGAGQNVTLRRGVLADTDDDGLDTLGSTVLVEDYIFRNCFDKGISVFDGQVTLDYVLIVNNGIGISAKANSRSSAQVFLNHATVVCHDFGIQAFNKYNPTDPLIEYFVTNSIILAANPVYTDYDPADIHIDYSDIGETWPGIDNINQDPLFVDSPNNNYHLQENSPCINAGSDDGVAGVQGYYQYEQSDLPTNGNGILTENTVWTPQEGPYRITGELTVPFGVNLTIMPGTTVFIEPDTKIIIEGRLIADGTEYELIRFTRTSGESGTWDGIQFANTMAENRITYAVVEYGRSSNGMIGLENSNLLLDHVTLDNTDLRRISTINSSLIVSNCVFTDIFGPDEPPTTDNRSEHIWGSGIPENGYFIIENNVLGTTKGHNDAIDFNGPSRPNPIVQILDNVFMGGGDDALDLEADAHIEGNVFMHYHKDVYNKSSGEANVISAGAAKEYCLVRNIFQDIDHAVLIKDNAFASFINNTVVDADKAVFYFDRAGQVQPGRGVYVDGSIFRNTGLIFDEVIDTTDITVNRSIIPETLHYLGTGNIDADPVFVDPNTDFHLRAVSPAISAGPCGLDMGAYVPGGAAVCGELDELTYHTNATLIVGGPGITHYMYRLNSGPWSQELSVDIPIELTNLLNGNSYTVYVIGKNSAGIWQSEESPSASRTWTIDTSYSRLVINEVLAMNISTLEYQGTFPDLIELYYDGPFSLSLSGIGITDNPDEPTKFVFPGGITIDPSEYLVLFADSETTTSGIHLGFALNRDGEGIYLYDKNGVLFDSVEFGPQLPDLSIGRIGYDSQWQLTVPTFGQANIAKPLGNPQALKINEWLAGGEVLFEDDYIELFNPHVFPVDLSGLYITDNIITQPDKHKLGPLSFIAGEGFAVFNADDRNQPGHVDFRLLADGEILGLFDTELNEIDKVLYGPQTTDISQGRAPNGSNNFEFFNLPTPGVANPLGGFVTVTSLIAIDDLWAYEQTDTALPVTWVMPNYNDSSWPTGRALLYVENSSLPAPKNTQLTIGAMTYYFRKHFTFNANPNNITELELSTVIDDGAVFYINGIEVLRIGMPDNAIENTTRADRSVGNADYEGPFKISTEHLLSSDNVIAVEVHQTNSTSSDIVFGLQLNAVETTSDESLADALALLDGLHITELMYHAPDGGPEFVELQNISQTTLDLTGVRFTEGIDFTFSQMSLEPGQYVVIAGDLASFRSKYGTNTIVAGEYSGNLNNGGENIVLKLPQPLEAAILRFEYSNKWYPTTDGGGNSLMIVDAAAHPATLSQPESWQPAAPSPGW